MVYCEGFNAGGLHQVHGPTHQDAKRQDHLIVDNLRVHHCKPVEAWVAQRANEIEPAFPRLPYSPEHNPDEYLEPRLKVGDGKEAIPALSPT